MRYLHYLQRALCLVLALLTLGTAQTSSPSPPSRLAYYGVDAATPEEWEWLASQGTNAVFLAPSGDGAEASLYQSARDPGVKLFVWPPGSGEEHTPWVREGGNDWSIDAGRPLLQELAQNHDVVIAVMSLHEPHWRGGAGAIPSESLKALADMIRDYTRSQGHELEILNLVTAVYYWQDDPRYEFNAGIGFSALS